MDPSADAVAAAAAVDDTARDERRIGYIGKTLGRFAIRAELGRGGMATVYRAHDPQLGRDVAIKVMHGFFAGRADLEARFRREASAVAGIRHPSVLALYDFSPPRGEEPGYLVTELIDGPDLRQVVDARRGHLLPESALLFGAQIADALGAVHAAGVVHRDVKPDNVLIDRGGTAGVTVPRVVLTDFGVAHVGGLDTMTATGAVLGSPAYMSPEQARGDEVGPTSDVFSLGVVLYQMCTGHLPFCGKDPITTLSAILRGELTRPAKLDPHVSPELEAIILRCLDRDPSARFANGSAVASVLREMLGRAGPALADEGAALKRFLADPAEFERGLAPRIADQACGAAERARKQRQGARALAELGRALAYAPHDARAQLLLQQMASGGRWKRTGAWATAGVMILGGAVAAALAIAHSGGGVNGLNGVMRWAPWRRAGGADVASGVVARVARPTPPETPASQPMAEGPFPVTAESAVAPARDAIVPGHHPGRNADSRVRAGAGRHKDAISLSAAAVRARTAADGRKVGVAPPSSQEAPSALRSAEEQRDRETDPGSNGARAAVGDLSIAERSEGPSSAAGREAVEDRKPAPSPALLAGLALRASHGFCEPSLDDHAPSLRATYAGLEAGVHDVYCTLPLGGPKVLVARYELKAGARPTLSIVPGPDGKPTLARPE